MVAHNGRVMPPGSNAGADEEPEDAGGAAVEKDVVRMHVSGDGGSMVEGGFYSTARAIDDDSVRRWLSRCRRYLQYDAVAGSSELNLGLKCEQPN